MIINPKCQICWDKPAVTTRKLLDEIDKKIKDFRICEKCLEGLQ